MGDQSRFVLPATHVLAGRYTIHAPISSGAMGAVYRDRDDTRMLKHRKQPRLDLEALGVVCVFDVLDRNRFSSLRIAGTVHGAHRAAGDRSMDRVASRQDVGRR